MVGGERYQEKSRVRGAKRVRAQTDEKGEHHIMTQKVTVTNDTQMVGEGVGFDRIRRITGYLVGTLDRFNNAKRAEEHDRVKHGI